MIYTEPFVVTGGGPGNSTTFLSIDLVKLALGQFDLGKAARHVDRLQPDHPGSLLGVLHGDDEDAATAGAPDHAGTTAHHRPLPRLPARCRSTGCINMSFKTNAEIISGLTALAASADLRELRHHLHRLRPGTPATSTRSTYVVMNTVLSIALALPAAYAFSRYRFLGDKHLFFWLLTNRMAPPAGVRAAVLQALLGHRACSTRRWPWRSRTACSTCRWPSGSSRASCPACRAEIDETAYIDGYALPALLREDIHAADRLGHRRRRVLLLHVLVGRAAARPHAHHRQRQADRGDDDPHGLAPPAWTGACSPPPACCTIVPGALVIWFVRNYIAKGFALGRV